MTSSEKILILGSGNMALRHAKHLQAIRPSVKIAFFSRTPHAHVEGYKVYYDLDTAIKVKPFAALVCNAAPSHCNDAAYLMMQGIHVFIEKPISDNYEEASKFLDYSLQYPRTVSLVGYHLHFKPGYEFVKKSLEDRILGDLYYANCLVRHYLPKWRPKHYSGSVSAQKSLGGGVLLELSHEFDYIKSLFGSPEKLYCHTLKKSNLDIDVEDIASTIFQYDSGFSVHIHQDMISLPPTRYLVVVGSKGTLHWDLRKDIVKVFTNTTEEWGILFEEKDIQKEQPYTAELEHFFNCIEGKEISLISIDDACETLRLVERAKLSAQLGVAVDTSNFEFINKEDAA